jgi:hypothetical protein
MYGYYDVSSHSALNSYVLHLLVEEEMIPTGYSWSPIIPAQQDQELMSMNPEKPFIVYDVRTPQIGVDWFMYENMISYVVYSSDAAEANRLVNWFVDVFRRFDQSAEDVNTWLRSGTDERLKKFNFHQINVAAAVPVEPAENEGGRYSGFVSLRYSFSTPNDQNGRRNLL